MYRRVFFKEMREPITLWEQQCDVTWPWRDRVEASYMLGLKKKLVDQMEIFIDLRETYLK